MDSIYPSKNEGITLRDQMQSCQTLCSRLQLQFDGHFDTAIGRSFDSRSIGLFESVASNLMIYTLMESNITICRNILNIFQNALQGRYDELCQLIYNWCHGNKNERTSVCILIKYFLNDAFMLVTNCTWDLYVRWPTKFFLVLIALSWW